MVKDQFGEDNYQNSVGGGLVGLLVGVLGGLLGVLIGGATGLLIGSLFDGDEDDETESASATSPRRFASDTRDYWQTCLSRAPRRSTP